MHFVAPAGTRIKIKDLFFWIINLLKKENPLHVFKKAVCDKFNTKHCYFWGTGRTGMSFLLKSLYDLDNKKRFEIIIPSYTCYSVPASIEYAGLKVRILDIDPKTLDYDYSQLEKTNFNNVLAILSSSLYGIPNNLEKLEQVARQKKIYFIDDAAQSMGAKCNSRYAGTFGDAGLFSLDKGKNITTIDGGIIVTNSDSIAEKLGKYSENLESSGLTNSILYILKIIIYSFFLRPSLYWIPNSIPFLKLGETHYDSQMPLFRYSKIQASLGIEALKSMDKVKNERIKNALLLKSKLQAIPGLYIPEMVEGTEEVFLRLPVLVDKKLHPKIIKALNKKGIGATGSYPKSVFDVSEIKKLCNIRDSRADKGRQVAEEIITLPTHNFVEDKHIETIYKTFEQLLV